MVCATLCPMSTMLLEKGQELAELLRHEGRTNYAETVDQFIMVVSRQADMFVTTEQYAERLDVDHQTILNWIEKGWLNALQVEDHYFVSAELVAKVDIVDGMLDEIEAEYPPLSPEQAAELLTEDRKDWTWNGKEN